MNNNNDEDTIDLNEQYTLKKLKNNGIFIKGASKAFTSFLVLWYLSKKDMHGYMIMKKIDEFFKPQIEIGLMKSTKANKIYPLLKEMNQNKLIEFYNGIHKKKNVKIYKLTEEGYKTLELIKIYYKRNMESALWKELVNDLKN